MPESSIPPRASEELPRVLITGATGYIGGRLVPILLDKGYRVRCLVRNEARLDKRGWEGVEVVEGDVLKPETLGPALQNVDVAYYLVHSLAAGRGHFASLDEEAAANFGTAARDYGVDRMIYLGGLGDAEDDLSQHLLSRQKTGARLRESGVPVTEFRAGVILGSGSLSFELIRYLSERLPVMVAPSWVNTLIQPIGVQDVLRYLAEALERPASTGKIIELCGPNLHPYGDLLQLYAKVRGLPRRRIIQVPVLTPRLASYWIRIVTPLPARTARPLIEGMRNEVVCHSNAAREIFPFDPISSEEAMERALAKLASGEPETSWADAWQNYEPHPLERHIQEGMVYERQQGVVRARPAHVFAAVCGLGGEGGWLYADSLWKIRGWFDRLVGGVGLQRGRLHAGRLHVGDYLDFWRVEVVEAPHLLRLHAEMRTPGEAWLQFEIEDLGEQGSRLSQTAYYAPRGLPGHLYWWAMWPLHKLLFPGLLRRLTHKAEALEADMPRST